MATITVLKSSTSTTSLAESASFMYKGARQEESKEYRDSFTDREASTCHRHRRPKSGKGGDHNLLVTLVYSVCCIYQFMTYLPLLVLRICFGSSPSDGKTRSNARHRGKPSVITLACLMLLGLPLMVLARLPIVGSLISLVSPPAPRKSRSRASSISSGSGSRRSYSVCSAEST